MKKSMMKLKRGKPFVYYWLVAMVIIFAVNIITTLLFGRSSVTSVTYDVFLDDLDAGKIATVQVMNESIMYGIDTIVEGEEETHTDIYSTTRMQDDDLVDKLYESGAEFIEIYPNENSFIMNIINTIIMVLIFALVWRFVMSKMMKNMGGGNSMSFGKSNAKIYAETQTGKSFLDVAGQEEAKEALNEVVDFLNNPKKYADIGANLPKGVLLVGPPGTGKTLLAKAVAGEAKVPFFSISGSEFVEMFVGMGAAKVRDLFKQANEKAPCIIFIDEIDTIGKKRDSAMGGNDEREQTLNQLLTEMDGFDGQKGVVLLAASNRPEILDKALTRPGRFDRRIPVELPDKTGRQSILEVHGKNVKLADDIDYEKIARATSGANGAELANIINEAALRAVRDGRQAVMQSDLEESVEVVIAGYQRKNASVSEKERKIVSYHEVGHALVAALQSDSAPVHKITIIPRTSGALGYTMQVDEDEKFLMSKEQALSKIATFTAGRAAEELIFKSITTGASNDIEQATRIARAMITRYGMSDKFGMVALETVNNQYLGGDTSLACSSETARIIDEEVIKIIGEQYGAAMRILKENEEKLHDISSYLLEKETITGDEFMTILNK